MLRKILVAGAAVAALSIAACNKPADTTDTAAETTTEPTTDITAGTEGSTADGGGSATAPSGSGGGGSGGGATQPSGEPVAADNPAPVTPGTVDTAVGPATATTPTSKVPLETTRKNNPPSNGGE